VGTLQNVAVISRSQMAPVLVSGDVTIWPPAPSGCCWFDVVLCAATGDAAKSRATTKASLISNLVYNPASEVQKVGFVVWLSHHASSSGNLPRICSNLHLRRTPRRRLPTSPGRILRIHNRRNLQSRSLLCSLRHSHDRNLRSLCNHHHHNRGHTRSRHLWRAGLRV
jgi:hypothetical protein